MTDREQSQIGGPGIDTEWERSKIEYRPKLEYERAHIEAPELTRHEIDRIAMQNHFIQPTTRKMWNHFVEVVEDLIRIEDQLSKRLHDTHALVPQWLLNEVRQAATKYNEVVVDRISFQLYQKALRDRISSERQIIMDVYEEYHSDVHGNILAEVYPDAVEMMQDWQDMFGFINKGVFSQLVGESQLPYEIRKQERAIDAIEKKEVEMADRYKSLEKEINQLRDEIGDLYISKPDSTEFFEKNKELSKLQEQLDSLNRRLVSRNDTTSMSEVKAIRAKNNLETLKVAINFEPYKGQYEAILFSLLSQYTTGQSMENGLRKLQTILKLSVDNKNDVISEKKENLRNLSGRENRTRINDTLVHGVHLRNEVFSDVLGAMSMYGNDPGSAAFQLVAEHIVDGIALSKDLYQQNTGDFYKMHSLEAELRLDKIHGILDKDSAREVYKLLDKLIIYAKERDSWPTQHNLREWIGHFLASQKLS